MSRLPLTRDPMPVPDALIVRMTEWRQAHPQATFRDLEIAATRQVATLRAELLAVALTTGEPGTAPGCPTCGTTMVRIGMRRRTITTSQAESVTVAGVRYRCAACGAELSPLAEALDLGPSRYSSWIVEGAVRLGMAGPFAPAARLLAWFTGVTMSPATRRRRTIAAGTAISGGRTLDVILQAQTSLLAMAEYLRPIIADRRVRPADDLLSALVAVEQQGELLNETELVATCMLLLIAGSETTTNLIGNGMLALLRNPDQLAQLRAGKEGIRPAVEELLRYDTPVQASFRVAREATVIAGAPIQPGDMVVMVLGAANRDPAQFPEPNRLDLRRGDRRHLSFAHGPHFCLGAALARLEAQVAITAILERLPGLRLASDQADWRPLFAFRGLQSLPVAC